jgi:hypothetical protein
MDREDDPDPNQDVHDGEDLAYRRRGSEVPLPDGRERYYVENVRVLGTGYPKRMSTMNTTQTMMFTSQLFAFIQSRTFGMSRCARLWNSR